jgi:uncharacterized repeat protein (TIGR01451 family)
MPKPPRRIGVIIATAALVAALAALQGVAAGATVTKATIEGVTSTSSPPASVLPASMTVSIGLGEAWVRTGVTFTPTGGGEPVTRCINTDNYLGGEPTASFDVTAPGPPGGYDVAFTPYRDGDCTEAIAPPFVLRDGLRVTQPAPNPRLPARCGIDVALILDSSGSIGDDAPTVRTAVRSFLTALSGTGSQVSIVDFNAQATRPVPYTVVSSTTIADTFDPYLKNTYKPGGTTNWEAAFQRVVEANAAPGGPVADLVLFITDGDPNTFNNDSGGTTYLTPDGNVTVMRRAVTQADLVKRDGSHVFALGVGAAVTGIPSQQRLTAVSGTDKYPVPQDNFSQADYGIVGNIADLPDALREFATELCKGSLTVTKLVDEGDGAYRPDPGWNFRLTVETSPGSYKWVSPGPPTAPPPATRTQATDEDGVAGFQWRPDDPTATSVLTGLEEVEDGYAFVDRTCSVFNLNGRVRTIRGTTPGPARFATLGPNQYAKCTVRNRILPGTIEIEKSATPTGSQAFAFTGSGPLGSFSLVDTGRGGSSSRTFTGLAPATYRVTETVPAGWSLTGASCSTADGTVAGATATITLTPQASTVCTFRNTRDDTPPPAPPPTTRLRILKTAPAVARAGQKAQFALTVTNAGPVTARDVRLADVPPASIQLQLLSSDTRVRIEGGNAVWRLGDLAPGAKRTVRGTVRIVSATPGLKRNLALATADNANLVQDPADTRVLAQRRITPPVTG